MNKLLAVVLAFIMAASSPVTICAQEVVGVAENEVEAAGEEDSVEGDVTDQSQEPEMVTPFDGQEDEEQETPEDQAVSEEQTTEETQDVPEGQEVIEVEDVFEEIQVSGEVQMAPDQYGVNFELSNAQLAGKRMLYQALDSLEGAIPGRDYLKNQIVVEAKDEGQAAETARGFDGELLSFQDGIAVIETKMSTYEAVLMSADMSVKLPAAYPNFWYKADGEKKYYAVDFSDGNPIEFEKEEFPDIKNSINTTQSQIDMIRSDAPDSEVDAKIAEDVTGAAASPVNDPDVPKQWYHQVIDTFNAWKVTKGTGVKVAVVDSGIQENHEEFAGRVAAVNKVTSVSALNGAQDNVGHGTHVAGIIGAAADNGKGGVGVAPEVEILSVKALEKYVDSDGYETAIGSTADIVAAVNYAVAENAKVINMSLGGQSSITDILYQQAVKSAVAKGIVVVVAAGNESMDISKEDNRVAPACLDGVITVASLEQSGGLSYFSNYGEIDVSAPGGSGLYTDDPKDIYSTSIIEGGYEYMAGTSMACPVVSGVVALVAASGSYEANEDGVKKITNTLKSSCIKIGSPKNFGSGRVNAAAAVNAVSIYTKNNSFDVVKGKSLKLMAATAGKKVKPVWSISGNAAGCTISKSGVFKAAKTISALTTVYVTATCGDRSDTVEITVYPSAGVITSSSGKSITLNIVTQKEGNQYNIVRERTKFSVASTLPYTYKTSNNKVAFVDTDGMIYALSNGKATITATTVGGKKATLKVKVVGMPYVIDRIVPAKKQHKAGAEMFLNSYMGQIAAQELGGNYIIYPVSAGKAAKFKVVSNWPYNTSSNKKVKWDSIGGTIKSGSYKMSKNISGPTLGAVVAEPVQGIGSTGVYVYGFRPMSGFHFGRGGKIITKVKSSTSVSVPVGSAANVEYSVLIPYGSSKVGLNPYPYVESSDESVAVGFFDEEYRDLRIKVIGKKPGQCKLTLISMDGAYKKATINVTVN